MWIPVTIAILSHSDSRSDEDILRRNSGCRKKGCAGAPSGDGCEGARTDGTATVRSWDFPTISSHPTSRCGMRRIWHLGSDKNSTLNCTHRTLNCTLNCSTALWTSLNCTLNISELQLSLSRSKNVDPKSPFVEAPTLPYWAVSIRQRNIPGLRNAHHDSIMTGCLNSLACDSSHISFDPNQTAWVGWIPTGRRRARHFEKLRCFYWEAARVVVTVDRNNWRRAGRCQKFLLRRYLLANYVPSHVPKRWASNPFLGGPCILQCWRWEHWYWLADAQNPRGTLEALPGQAQHGQWCLQALQHGGAISMSRHD